MDLQISEAYNTIEFADNYHSYTEKIYKCFMLTVNLFLLIKLLCRGIMN